MGDEMKAMIDQSTGLMIVQPRLEPWPSGIRKVGRFAAFFYVRWSSWGIVIEWLFGGLALIIGPAMNGVVHIRLSLDGADRFDAATTPRHPGADEGTKP